MIVHVHVHVHVPLLCAYCQSSSCVKNCLVKTTSYICTWRCTGKVCMLFLWPGGTCNYSSLAWDQGNPWILHSFTYFSGQTWIWPVIEYEHFSKVISEHCIHIPGTCGQVLNFNPIILTYIHTYMHIRIYMYIHPYNNLLYTKVQSRPVVLCGVHVAINYTPLSIMAYYAYDNTYIHVQLTFYPLGLQHQHMYICTCISKEPRCKEELYTCMWCWKFSGSTEHKWTIIIGGE